jgi:putative component of membrane protein insertase Oxa1/YidC/SpoIIIJ protein YidD
MSCSAWAVRAAARIGQRAGYLAAAANLPRPNPFAGKPGVADLAAAWQDAYDRAAHPANGG